MTSSTLTRRDRLGWRSALRAVIGAAFRIHHYRDLRSRMLRDALCRLDCGPGSSDLCI